MLKAAQPASLNLKTDANWFDDILERIALWITSQLARLVGIAHGRMAKKVIGTITPLDTGIEPAIRAAREANILLIDKLNRGYAIAVREVLEQPDVFGLRVEEIRKRLLAKADISIRHADLIARDQTLKLNAAITRIRQQNAGVTHYRWSTSKDERVRPTHAALDGQVFSWSVGTPIGYHPGEDYQCRCIAVPLLDGPEESTPFEDESVEPPSGDESV